MSDKVLWYDSAVNRFKDGIGIDRTALFPTWILDVWKKTKTFDWLEDRTGQLWECYSDRFDLYHECTHDCRKCSRRCEIWELFYADGIPEWILKEEL